ncbi:MAG: hypothetical protein ABIH56_03795 [Candidatus Margulisiibacteriota bacterium]
MSFIRTVQQASNLRSSAPSGAYRFETRVAAPSGNKRRLAREIAGHLNGPAAQAACELICLAHGGRVFIVEDGGNNLTISSAVEPKDREKLAEKHQLAGFSAGDAVLTFGADFYQKLRPEDRVMLAEHELWHYFLDLSFPGLKLEYFSMRRSLDAVGLWFVSQYFAGSLDHFFLTLAATAAGRADFASRDADWRLAGIIPRIGELQPEAKTALGVGLLFSHVYAFCFFLEFEKLKNSNFMAIKAAFGEKQFDGCYAMARELFARIERRGDLRVDAFGEICQFWIDYGEAHWLYLMDD